jgi:hypothetical protein
LVMIKRVEIATTTGRHARMADLLRRASGSRLRRRRRYDKNLAGPEAKLQPLLNFSDFQMVEFPSESCGLQGPTSDVQNAGRLFRMMRS